MLGIEHSGIDEKVFSMMKSVKNPTSGLVIVDEIDIILWTSNILTSYVEEAKEDKDLVLKLESEIKKLRGEDLHKVMRFMIFLLLEKTISHTNKMVKMVEKISS